MFSSLCFFSSWAEPLAHELDTLGWVERVRIDPHGLLLKAKLDTGAESSSIDAADISFFKRRNKRWVRFSLRDENGTYHQIQRKVLRTVKIKRFSGNHRERPVILLKICVGNVLREAEFTLEDRSLFAYPVLIGRRLLSGNALVDASSMMTINPTCPVETTISASKAPSRDSRSGGAK